MINNMPHVKLLSIATSIFLTFITKQENIGVGRMIHNILFRLSFLLANEKKHQVFITARINSWNLEIYEQFVHYLIHHIQMYLQLLHSHKLPLHLFQLMKMNNQMDNHV